MAEQLGSHIHSISTNFEIGHLVRTINCDDSQNISDMIMSLNKHYEYYSSPCTSHTWKLNSAPNLLAEFEIYGGKLAGNIGRTENSAQLG